MGVGGGGDSAMVLGRGTVDVPMINTEVPSEMGTPPIVVAGLPWLIVAPFTSNWSLPSGVNAWPAAVNAASPACAGIVGALLPGMANVELPAIKPAVPNVTIVPSVVSGAPPIDKVAPFAITVSCKICVHV